MKSQWRLCAIVAVALGLVSCGHVMSVEHDHPLSNDPLKPARTGSFACIRPDIKNKRCNTLLRYAFNIDDSILAYADVTMSDSVVMSTKFDVTIRSRSVCSIGYEEDVQSALFKISGRSASAHETTEIREQLVDNIRTRGPYEVCMDFAPQSEGFMAETTVNGVRHPEMDEPMIWVTPDGGYTVGQ